MREKNPNRIWNLISFLVLILVAGSVLVLMQQIYVLKMLPEETFQLICGGAVLVILLLSLLLFTRKPKQGKKTRHGKVIIGYLLSALLIACCLFGSKAVGQVQHTLDSITNTTKTTVVLEIYVRMEDPAQSLGDMTGYTVGLPQEVSETDLAPIMEELEEALKGRLTTVSCSGTAAQIDALLSGEVDAVILDNAYLSVLEGMEGYSDYAGKIRCLHEKVFEKEVAQIVVPQEDTERSGFLMYVSGRDSWYGVLSNGRSDVNILVAVNPETHQVLLVNTPRDYYVVNPASGRGAKDKLTHCSIPGVENSMSALALLYGYSPDYYARINFTGFETLVDAIGGVTIYSEKSFSALGTYINKGENHLNGQQALNFARERKNLWGGDNDRGKNQMKLVEGILNQLTAENLLNNYSQILQSLEGMFATSMPSEKISELVQMQIAQMPDWEFFSFAVTGDNGTDHCWAAGGYAYVMYPHESMVAKASELLGKVLTGEKLTQEDLVVNP